MWKRKVQWVFVLFVAALDLTGCKTHREIVKFTRALATNDVTLSNVAALKDTPVLDVHTHNFNARDIPLRNIALARRDVVPAVGWLVSDDAASALAAAILAETRPEKKNDRVVHENTPGHQRAIQTALQMNLRPKAVAALTNTASYSATTNAVHNGISSRSPTFKEKIVLKSIAATASHQNGLFSTVMADIDAIVSFMQDLTRADVQLLDQYWQENPPAVQFRIAHMMDMAPTYAPAPPATEMNSITAQVDYMAKLQQMPNAKLAYFVSFNPFRDNTTPGEALHFVQDAVLNHGAYGVKLYPPAGYRVAGNAIPGRPWSVHSQPGAQWDLRYTKDGQKISGAELDERVLTLLLWCTSNNIPVFAHSGHGEFQALGGYGQDMPNPRWWSQLLKEHSELHDLRLCLGHAGGGDDFFASGGFKPWTRDAVDLCTHYPNVYCEVGCMDEILDPAKQAAFAASMVKLCNPVQDTNTYSFADKIMYGSDWYMPIKGGVDRARFLGKFQEVFLLPELSPCYRRFFFINALNYLNAANRVNDRNFPIDPVPSQQLSELLKTARL